MLPSSLYERQYVFLKLCASYHLHAKILNLKLSSGKHFSLCLLSPNIAQGNMNFYAEF